MAQTIKLKRTSVVGNTPIHAPSFVAGEMMINTTDLRLWAMGISFFEILTDNSSINDLGNVLTSMTPSDGQVLTYDTTNGWQAEDASASGTTTYIQTLEPAGWVEGDIWIETT